MVRRWGIAIIAMAATRTGAQTVVLTLEFERAVVHPGEVQRLAVSASFKPGVGAVVPWSTPPGTGQPAWVAGFSHAMLDVLNAGNGETGTYSGLAVNLSALGSAGVSAGGGVQGITAFQGPPLNASNPIRLWTAVWTPHDYEPRTVVLTTHPTSPAGIFLQVIGGSGLPVLDEWTAIGVNASFQVVPAPGAPVVLGALALARRRKRTSRALVGRRGTLIGTA